MATILFAAAGAALGAGVGGTALGLSGAVIGRAVGATIGRAVDQRIMGLGSDAVEVGKLDRFHVMGASEGAPIAKLWGRMRLAGQVIWASPFRETVRRSGGKGMPSQKTVQHSYAVSLAIALCEGEILGIGRIWADGDEISPKSLNIRVYNGSEDQLPDPLIEAQMGSALSPAYRGIAYVVIEELELSPFGNRVPQFSFEVMRRAQGPEAEKVPDLQDVIRAVALIPGTGEYALATQKMREERDFGVFKTVNVNSPSGESDLMTSLRQLRQELPNCNAVSLIISWFGSDLRCGLCEIQPKVEQKVIEIPQMPWRSGGVTRREAQEVPRVDGRSIYGGTPADASVIEAITALREFGQSVMFYPFILMDQIEGNALADPYSDNQFQPALPWRGRITLSTAPGKAFSPDQTEDAANEVAEFFGSAGVDDFSTQSGQIFYHGEEKWGYRRFILHYAHLCKIAGGVESFCIGSEMRGLTQIRGPEHSFPAVDALLQLAEDVRSILGPDVKISYAADWSEYFGYNSGDSFYFHLDPLWASANIDFIGIDNYMPISDWREGSSHADAQWRSIYNIDYLKSNISGGEGFDWYYSGDESAKAQRRTPIVDSAYGEDWVFRFKDLRSWWSIPHHDRVNGVRKEHATAWIPESKPIRFTEYGCPAVDKGTNHPNKFLDIKSSESSLPRASQGGRDDFIQVQYFRAVSLFWSDPRNNPVSGLFSGSMIDIDHSYAWAWDARPYPDFPRNDDVWSDGENYYRGHWLNGRATSVPLDRIVREICSDSDINCIETTHLHGTLHGYCVANVQSGRARIQPLSVTHGFDCIDRDGVLHFKSRDVMEIADISDGQISLRQNGSPERELMRLAGANSISKVRLSYIESDGNYSVAVSEASDSEAKSSEIAEAEYPIVLPASVAKKSVGRWLVEGQLACDQISLDLPLSAVSIIEGGAIKFEGLIYRIDRCEVNQGLFIRAVRVEPSIYTQASHELDSKRWIPHVEVGPVSHLWMDLPLMYSGQASDAPFLAVTSDPWPAPAVLWSSSEDYSYKINSILEEPSCIGTTLSSLPSSIPGIIDHGSELLLKMPFDTLESISLSELLSGGNLIAIGNGEPDKWEILQYMNVTLHSPGVYSVSSLLRGVSGSDCVMPSVWSPGSYVVLINDKLKQIVIGEHLLNVDRHYRLGFSSEDIGSEVMRHEVISFKGNSRRPFSVCHLSVHIDAANNHCFRWIRRTRTDGDSWQGYDVPLGEERELYLFTVNSGEGNVLLSHVLEVNAFDFSESIRVDVGAVGLYFVEVCQISVSYGIGPAKKMSVEL